ncbi:NADPH:quinone oxidoreductase family protein [Sphingomonas sp.]|uniref:NADPH:quinone oxidoreductase family protein n=1 Tax=Sphingomonas sp. TaxID=28214 RepID=UPI003458C141
MSDTPGGPETLTLSERNVAPPAAGEVQIDVHACGINFPDSLIIRDLYQYKPPRPFAPGGEVAGIVSAVGDNVAGFAPGDRVLARTGWGGLSETVSIDQARVAPLPEGMSFAEGSAYLFTYETSYHALKQRAACRPGDAVLVLGAAGGTGVSAIEIAKVMGARVVAAVSSEDKAAFVKTCGADDVIVYPRGPLSKEQMLALGAEFKAAGGAHGFDIVYDPVGGDYAEPAFRAMAWGGRYLVVGFTAGIPRLPFNLPLLKGAGIIGVFNGGFSQNEPEESARNTAELMDLYVTGKLRPTISSVVPFTDAPSAITAIADRQALGKIVVAVR